MTYFGEMADAIEGPLAEGLLQFEPAPDASDVHGTEDQCDGDDRGWIQWAEARAESEWAADELVTLFAG